MIFSKMYVFINFEKEYCKIQVKFLKNYEIDYFWYSTGSCALLTRSSSLETWIVYLFILQILFAEAGEVIKDKRMNHEYEYVFWCSFFYKGLA